MYSKTSRPSRNSSTSGRPSRFSNRPARGGNSSAGGRSFSGGRPQRHGGGGGFRNNGGRPSFGGGRRGGGRKMPTFDPSRFINTNPVDLVQEDYVSKNSFADFGVDKKLTKTITDMGLITPSPIQDQIIPLIMEGKDVIGIAETGTGKTAAFLIPIIEKTLKNPNEQTLILAPTRELAIQIADELRKLSRGFQIFGAVCVGGVNIQPQIRTLKHKNHFVIGTPGRVLEIGRAHV